MMAASGVLKVFGLKHANTPVCLDLSSETHWLVFGVIRFKGLHVHLKIEKS